MLKKKSGNQAVKKGSSRRGKRVYVSNSTLLDISLPATIPNLTRNVAMTPIDFVLVGLVGTAQLSTQNLPAGLTFAMNAGVPRLSGTPTAAAAVYPNVALTVTDSANGHTDSLIISLTIVASGALQITAPTAIGPFTKSQAITQVNFAASGGTAPYVWTNPDGVNGGLAFVDNGNNTAKLTGTPGTLNTTGRTCTFRCTDNTGAYVEQTFRIKVLDQAAVDLTWPRQDIIKGWGLTINGADWLTKADDLWQTLIDDPNLDEKEWQWARIQIDGAALEPTDGTVNVNVASGQIQWCQARGIRPILLYTYFASFRAGQYVLTGCTISNVQVNIGTTQKPVYKNVAQISHPNARDMNYDNLHVMGTGITNGSIVDTGPIGASGNGFICLDRTATPGSNITLTFGPAYYSGAWHATPDDHHCGINTDVDARKYANAVVKHLDQWSTGDPTTEPICEVGNESNGQFWKPRQNNADYNRLLRYIYRAVKEYNPGIAVAFTGLSSNNSTNINGWGVDGPIFWDASLVAQIADTTWDTWTELTTVDTTNWPLSKASNNLKALKTAGIIHPDHYFDLGGIHLYSYGRGPIGPYGTINFYNWSQNTGGGTSWIVDYITVLNACYTRDPSPGKTLLNKLIFISTESGPGHHPLAVTGRGWTGGGSGRYKAAQIQYSSNSEEEAYAFTIIQKQIVKWQRNCPTGGAVPAKLFTGEPGHRLGIINIQRLGEEAETYSGADYFMNQGAYTNLAFPGPPAIGSKVLKRAIAAEKPRPYINSGTYSNANIGNGDDFVDAFGRKVD